MPVKFWTPPRLWQLTEMLDAGLSDPAIARRFGKSVNGVRIARKRNHIASRQARFYSAHEIARLFGVRCEKTVIRWLRAGWMRGQRQRLGPRLHWHVRYDQITAFVADPAHWHRWQPERLTDDDLRAWATEMRRDMRYLTPGEVAKRLCVSVNCVGHWIRTGRLMAVRHGNWWIAESALVGFVPPYARDRHGVTPRRFTASEDARLLALRSGGMTWQGIADDLGRAVGSVAGRYGRLQGRQGNG